MDIITTIDFNIKNFSELLDRKKIFESEIGKREEEVEQYSERLKFLKGAREIYLKAVDIMYQESIGVLQDTLNSAMQYVMKDKDYAVKLELEDKRGSKSLNLALIDKAKGFEVDLKDGVGQGVRTIISFVLKAYYLVNEDSKILMLDEKYSALSAQYIPYFMEFLKKFTEERDFIIVMITHDNRFMNYGDKVYVVADGDVREENIDGESYSDTSIEN
jgi:putative ABC transport system ATP-binding protein